MNKTNYLDTVRAVEKQAQNAAYDIMPLLQTPTKGVAQCNIKTPFDVFQFVLLFF